MKTWQTIITTVLTSGLIATGVSTYMAKNNELETRTYELKYAAYSQLNDTMGEMEDALHFGSDEEVAMTVRDMVQQIPNLLLVTNDKDLVAKIIALRDAILETALMESGEGREKILNRINQIPVLLAADFSNFVIDAEELEELVNENSLSQKLQANVLQKLPAK